MYMLYLFIFMKHDYTRIVNVHRVASLRRRTTEASFFREGSPFIGRVRGGGDDSDWPRGVKTENQIKFF